MERQKKFLVRERSATKAPARSRPARAQKCRCCRYRYANFCTLPGRYEVGQRQPSFRRRTTAYASLPRRYDSGHTRPVFDVIKTSERGGRVARYRHVLALPHF